MLSSIGDLQFYSKEVDKLVERYYAETDPAKVDQLYRLINKNFNFLEDCIVIGRKELHREDIDDTREDGADY